MSELFTGLVVAVVSATVAYMFAKYHFYSSVRYQEALKFFSNYHIKLLVALHNVEFTCYLLARDDITVPVETLIESLRDSLQRFDVALREYGEHGGIMILHFLDEKLAAQVLGLQGRHDLWNAEKPFDPSTGELKFNISLLKELNQQLRKVSLKHILKSYRDILGMERMVS